MIKKNAINFKIDLRENIFQYKSATKPQIGENIVFPHVAAAA